VDIAQRAIQIGKLKEKNLNQDIDKYRQQRQEANLELKKYEDLDNIVDIINNEVIKYNELTKLQENFVYYSSSFEKINKFIEDAKRLVALRDSLTISFDCNEIVKKNDIIRLLYKLKTVENQINISDQVSIILKKEVNASGIKKLYETNNLIYKTISCKKRLDDLNNITDITIIDTKNVIDAKNILIEFKNYHKNINEVNGKIVNKDEEINKISTSYNTVVEELINYKKEIGVCPTCGETFR
jgi:hypothetical protein